MKTQTKPKSKFRGFYTALALSLVMIGAACVFAYRQTSQTLEQNLNSLSEQMEVTTTATLPYEAPVVGVQTDVAMETETTVTATSATEETAAPETTPETTAPETEPEETPKTSLRLCQLRKKLSLSSKRTLLRVASSRNLSLSSPAHAQAVVKLHTLS